MMKNILGHAVYQLTIIFFLVFAGEPSVGRPEVGGGVLDGDGAGRGPRTEGRREHAEHKTRRNSSFTHECVLCPALGHVMRLMCFC